MNIGIGKFKGFMRITNELGQFQMLALDQRNSLKKMITERKGSANELELVKVKRSILKNLSDKVTVVLVDGEYGFPENLKYISHHTGIILSAEKSGYVFDEKSPGEQLTNCIARMLVNLQKEAAWMPLNCSSIGLKMFLKERKNIR